MEKSSIPEIIAVRQDKGRVDHSKLRGGKHKADILSVYTKGGPRYRLNLTTYRITPPVVMLLPAGTSDRDLQVGEVNGIFALFKGHGLIRRKPGSGREVIIALGDKWLTVPLLKEISATAADRLVELLHSIGAVGGVSPTSRLRRTSLLYEALAEYAEYESRDKENTVHREAARLRDLIEARAFEHTGLKTIYSQLEISPAYAETLFRRAFGVTAAAYRLQLRLRRARELLATTTANVSQAAYAVGFVDALYFTKIFHKTFGVPPSRLIRDFNVTRNK
ncbi:MAG: AraC family transcriptional regulator [Kiritimatiellae bacterium]|nr:AraC family transcriptional regulator [Kiritimatiellia bacterium]